MLQFKTSSPVYICGGGAYDWRVRQAEAVASPDGGPQAVRIDQLAWRDDAAMAQWPLGPVTRCLLLQLPGYADPASAWLQTPLALGQDVVQEYLYVTPWDPSDGQSDLSFATVESGLADTVTGSPLYLINHPLRLRSSGEEKLRLLLAQAVELYETVGRVTEIELSNEINMAATGGSAGQARYAFPGPGLLPGAAADLLFEVCRVASAPEFLRFPTPDGRIAIIGPGLAQYTGLFEQSGVASVLWPPEWSPRNPYLNGRIPQSPGYPDVRYLWELLDAYYRLVGGRDGGPAAYPGRYSTRPDGVIDRLDGFAFHLYQGTDFDPRDVIDGEPLWARWARTWRRKANWLLSYAGVRACGPGGARYPAGYRELPVFATEASFLGCPTMADTIEAYGWVLDYYNQVIPTSWPQRRLRRLYLHPDDSAGNDAVFERGAEQSGADPAAGLTELGRFHRDLSFRG